MTQSSQIEQIAAFLRETGKAHHQAFIETDGFHPDWPLWYADYMHEKLPGMLNASITKSEVVYLLILLDRDQRSQAPGSEWSVYYAKALVARYL